jgi:hypothetical protein
MAFNEPMQERGRALEEEYFRRREQELVEKIRKAAQEKRERDGLAEKTGLTDPALVAEVQELGFTSETIGLLPLVPVLQVAWAEGGVSPEERAQILALARARGIADGSAAHAQLLAWLETSPTADTFAKATRLISAVLAADGAVASDLTVGDLVAYCEKVAAASGGLLGFGKVSNEEKAMLAGIASALKGRG